MINTQQTADNVTLEKQCH